MHVREYFCDARHAEVNHENEQKEAHGKAKPTCNLALASHVKIDDRLREEVIFINQVNKRTSAGLSICTALDDPVIVVFLGAG